MLNLLIYYLTLLVRIIFIYTFKLHYRNNFQNLINPNFYQNKQYDQIEIGMEIIIAYGFHW